jgi:beta-glucosidase
LTHNLASRRQGRTTPLTRTPDLASRPDALPWRSPAGYPTSNQPGDARPGGQATLAASAVTHDMPWLSQVAAVVDAWYPGESNGTALASVLFGQVDPSGHLPVTFPEDLSQVPASSAAQFPGVNGEVQYSEGVDVGYRYYDASNETPMFPFGYGLSYTNFSYSHLAITPQQVSNTSSNPGRPAADAMANRAARSRCPRP